MIVLHSDPSLPVWVSKLRVEESEPLLYSYEFTLALGHRLRLGGYHCVDLDPAGDPSPESHWNLRSPSYDEFTDEFPELELTRLLCEEVDHNPALRPLGAPVICEEVFALATLVNSWRDQAIEAVHIITSVQAWGPHRWDRPGLSEEDLEGLTEDLAQVWPLCRCNRGCDCRNLRH